MKLIATVDEESTMYDAIVVDFTPEGASRWECYMVFEVGRRLWSGPAYRGEESENEPDLTRDQLIALIPEAIIARCMAAAIAWKKV